MTDIYKTDESDQHYTPPALVELAREVFAGGIELDPCTHPSNPTNALTFYTSSALELEWCSRSVNCWLNPPYGRRIGQWDAKLHRWLALRPERQSLALVPARVGAAWYRRATTRANVVCELDGRVRFHTCSASGLLVPEEHEARWGSVLLYNGPFVERARRLLRSIGAVRTGARRTSRPIASPRPLARAIDARQVLAPGLCSSCFAHADHCTSDRACCLDCTHGARLRLAR